MKLQYRIGKLELDNMELEQSRIVHESAMRGKDLTIEKLQLQVRDRIALPGERFELLQGDLIVKNAGRTHVPAWNWELIRMGRRTDISPPYRVGDNAIQISGIRTRCNVIC